MSGIARLAGCCVGFSFLLSTQSVVPAAVTVTVGLAGAAGLGYFAWKKPATLTGRTTTKGWLIGLAIYLAFGAILVSSKAWGMVAVWLSTVVIWVTAYLRSRTPTNS
jgi:hypothetical protein